MEKMGDLHNLSLPTLPELSMSMLEITSDRLKLAGN